MQGPIGKCGNCCGTCPWGRFRRAQLNDMQWLEYREEAKKYVGYSPTENPCHGCQTPDAKLAKNVGVHNFLRGCLARKCANYSEIENCAHCSRYPCDWIESRVDEITRASVSKRIGEPVPDYAYQDFIEPFQGKAHLDEIRLGLTDDAIVEAKTIEGPMKKILEYPESTKLKGMPSESFRNVHAILEEVSSSDFGLKHPDTLAGFETIKNRRDILLRLLWIAFENGQVENDGKSLILDGMTYGANKKGKDPLAMVGRAESYFRMLREIGIIAELEQLHDEWTTGLGYLRTQIPGTDKPTWNLVINFEKRIGGPDALRAMKFYASELSREFKNTAYSRFSKADFKFLAA